MEEPLPAGGSCLLGSINLAEFVKNSFTEDAEFLQSDLENCVKESIIALNDILDEGLELHPLQEQRDSVRQWRQVGLGIMGLADFFIKLGITYGSEGSLATCKHIMNVIARTAVKTSLELAKTKGCFEKCNKEALVNSSFIQRLGFDDDILNEIRKYGLRNSQLLTCAPTGSIGTMLQISTGMECNYAFSYSRRTISLNNKETIYNVEADIVKQYKSFTKNVTLPKYFVSTMEVNPMNRLKVQAAIGYYIDASVSSTLNLPENTTEDDVYNIYIEAWRLGLKGITIWRDNCKRTAILSTSTVKEESNTCLNCITPITRDTLGQVLTGQTFKRKTACGTLYVTVNRDQAGNIVEIFTNSSKNGTCKANLNGETRMASLALRAGVKVEEVIDQLQHIHCQSCAYMKAKGTPVDGLSCPDIISKCLKEAVSVVPIVKNTIPVVQKVNEDSSIEKCPECGRELIHEGGCKSCPSCGWSRC